MRFNCGPTPNGDTKMTSDSGKTVEGWAVKFDHMGFSGQMSKADAEEIAKKLDGRAVFLREVLPDQSQQEQK